MTNIRDVAKEAGVSTATVSRYLNKSGYVSDTSRESIKKAIQTLNYKPSSVARSLSKKQTNYIVLIVPDIHNPFFPELARAVEDIALTYDYTVILCNSDEDAQKELAYLESLKEQYVAGFIITTSALEHQFYQTLDVPIVALDRKMDEFIPTVSSDNISGAKIGTEHLMNNDAQHIVCLRGPEGVQTADDRLTGFLQATKHRDIKTTIVPCPFHFAEAQRIVMDLLKNDPTIDRIFASSDISAAGALKAAHALHIQVPEQLQIIGFDNIDLSEMLTPGLTTIAQDIYQLGAVATRLLIKQIEHLPIEQRAVQIPVQLIQRETTRSE